jgi:hypothetical protein
VILLLGRAGDPPTATHALRWAVGGGEGAEQLCAALIAGGELPFASLIADPRASDATSEHESGLCPVAWGVATFGTGAHFPPWAREARARAAAAAGEDGQASALCLCVDALRSAAGPPCLAAFDAASGAPLGWEWAEE